MKKEREGAMEAARIEIVIGTNGKVEYRSNMTPPITIFYLEFVKADLIERHRKPQEKSQIIVPQILPPERPEG